MINDSQAKKQSNTLPYHPPQLFVVGTAVELVRGSYTGSLRDASNSWLWGS